MQDLGTLSGDTDSQAFGVSADGLVVVGVSGSWNAFRWTAEGGMERLPGGGTAYGVSSDGWVVVGWSSNGVGGSLGVGFGRLGGGKFGHFRWQFELGIWCVIGWARGGGQGIQRCRAVSCLSLDGGWWDGGFRHF
jgi:hypothetical protein